MTYPELHAHSCFSFLDGASQPDELAARAAALGYDAVALTDHDGLSGSLAFAQAAREVGVRPITGCEITLQGGAHLTLLCEDRRGYANLCRLITAAHAHDRRKPEATLEQVARHADGLHCLSGCARHGAVARLVSDGRLGEAEALARRLRDVFGRDRFSIEIMRPYMRGDARRNRLLGELADRLRLRTVATGDVHAHTPRRALLQDALVAIRSGTTLEGCEAERRGNHESVLRAPSETAARFPADAVRAAAAVADRCRFDLTQDLGYAYPDFSDSGEPAQAALARICREELECRYRGSPNWHEARARLEEELGLIALHGLAGFFLLHRDILEMARDVAVRVRGASAGRRLLPPGRGRGSSVGSIVCYLIGLSHVDPVATRLFLGRFLSRDLASVPDIDLDFPRDVREGLMLDIVDRYGPEHAALVAAFPTYRTRGAIRDLGKALALPQGEVERMARLADEWGAVPEDRIDQLRDRMGSARWRAFAFLMEEIRGLPRHISQHSGGMVISTRPLVELVPVIPAAMEGRQICQWDKDSCSDAGFLKIDLLGLGMLSAVEECVDLIAETRGSPIDLSPGRVLRPGGLRRDPGRRHDRGVPDREPGADAVAAPDAAREPRRPDRPGRARPSRADRRGRGQPVHRPPPQPAPRSRVPPALRPPPARAGAGRHPRRGRLPGPGARGRHRPGRVHHRRGREPAPGDEPQAQPRGAREPPAPVPGRGGRPGASTRRPPSGSSRRSSPSRSSASPRATPPPSRSSPTSRRGCTAHTRRSSCARS